MTIRTLLASLVFIVGLLFQPDPPRRSNRAPPPSTSQLICRSETTSGSSNSSPNSSERSSNTTPMPSLRSSTTPSRSTPAKNPHHQKREGLHQGLRPHHHPGHSGRHLQTKIREPLRQLPGRHDRRRRGLDHRLLPRQILQTIRHQNRHHPGHQKPETLTPSSVTLVLDQNVHGQPADGKKRLATTSALETTSSPSAIWSMKIITASNTQIMFQPKRGFINFNSVNPDNPERNDKTVEAMRVRWLSAFAFAIGLVGFALYVWYQSRK